MSLIECNFFVIMKAGRLNTPVGIHARVPGSSPPRTVARYGTTDAAYGVGCSSNHSDYLVVYNSVSLQVITTARLQVRLPREADRDRFVQLFCDEDFMVYYPGVLTGEQAEDRFDHMVAVCQTIPFGKQPVVELSSGLVVGYTGVDYIDFEGRTWLEWGYRLAPESRGLGYATEASQALLAQARQAYAGELLAIIAPENLASQNVCRKLGFTFWKQAPVEGDIRNLYTLVIRRRNQESRSRPPDRRRRP